MLSSGFHPRNNGENEQLSQEMEVAFRFVTNSNPYSRGQRLPVIEHAHKSHANVHIVHQHMD